MLTLMKWIAMVVLVVVAVPFVIVAGRWAMVVSTKVSPDQSQKKAPSNQEEPVLTYDGDQSVERLQANQALHAAADRDLQAASERLSAIEANVMADALANITKDTPYIQVVLDQEVFALNERGEVVAKLAVGQVVRYYPTIGTMLPNGQLQRFGLVAVPPYTLADRYWVSLSQLPVDQVVSQTAEWYPMVPINPRVIKEWGVELAPGEKSPPLRFTIEEEVEYSLDLNDNDGQARFAWAVNNGEWIAIAVGRGGKGPRLEGDLEGVVSLQVKANENNNKSERLRFALMRPEH